MASSRSRASSSNASITSGASSSARSKSSAASSGRFTLSMRRRAASRRSWARVPGDGSTAASADSISTVCSARLSSLKIASSFSMVERRAGSAASACR